MIMLLQCELTGLICYVCVIVKTFVSEKSLVGSKSRIIATIVIANPRTLSHKV